jgi:hypothetical protein
MITKSGFLVASLLVAPAIGLLGCAIPSTTSSIPNPVVGAWLVHDPNAPFPYHMYVFNADGTMQQANPDAGILMAATATARVFGLRTVSGSKASGSR